MASRPQSPEYRGKSTALKLVEFHSQTVPSARLYRPGSVEEAATARNLCSRHSPLPLSYFTAGAFSGVWMRLLSQKMDAVGTGNRGGGMMDHTGFEPVAFRLGIGRSILLS